MAAVVLHRYHQEERPSEPDPAAQDAAELGPPHQPLAGPEPWPPAIGHGWD
jgi:hypothetical protein